MPWAVGAKALDLDMSGHGLQGTCEDAARRAGTIVCSHGEAPGRRAMDDGAHCCASRAFRCPRIQSAHR